MIKPLSLSLLALETPTPRRRRSSLVIHWHFEASIFFDLLKIPLRQVIGIEITSVGLHSSIQLLRRSTE